MYGMEKTWLYEMSKEITSFVVIVIIMDITIKRMGYFENGFVWVYMCVFFGGWMVVIVENVMFT